MHGLISIRRIAGSAKCLHSVSRHGTRRIFIILTSQRRQMALIFVLHVQHVPMC
jgi:hypothetical protein